MGIWIIYKLKGFEPNRNLKLIRKRLIKSVENKNIFFYGKENVCQTGAIPDSLLATAKNGY